MNLYQSLCRILISLLFCFKFGNMFTNLIQQFVQLSLNDCKTKCNNEIRCLSADYYRKFNLCKLNDMVPSISTKEPAKYLFIKPQELVTEQNNPDFNCGENFEICQRKNCPILDIHGADIVGNMFETGAEIRYTCRQSGDYVKVTCFPNGTWSYNSLICPPCTYPYTKPHLTVGPLISFDNNSARLDMMCSDGFSLRYREHVTCDISTGLWSNYGYVSCDQIQDGPWLKVYSAPSGNSGLRGIISPLMSDADEYDVDLHGFFRNKTVFSNWQNMQINRINFTILKNDSVAAYILFDGTSTNNMSWFSKSNLLESSWAGLNPSTTIDIFSVAGDQSGRGIRRFLVASRSTWDSCELDRGWFAVTYQAYPCDGIGPIGQRFSYSLGGNASKFIAGEIGFADRFEIWIEF